MREATRTDWRFLLGLKQSDVVLAVGPEAPRLTNSLAPWVAEVREFAAAGPAADWAFLSGNEPGESLPGTLARTYAALRPGGHLAMTLENRWGLHWIADWRPAAGRGASVAATGVRHGLPWHVEQFQRAGADHICAYALLPSRDAPRAIIPVDPPCPPAAQKMALDQVWQRATPPAALLRLALGVLVSAGVMRHLYPHYLVVGRKPC